MLKYARGVYGERIRTQKYRFGARSLDLKNLSGALVVREECKTKVPTMPAMPGSRRILIVDDEPNVTETLGLIFSTRGYEVREAYSAEQAIEVLAEWKPDLAIVDVMLPQMNGIEFGIALEANYPECQLLLLSGHPGTGALLEWAKERGHNFDILAKPLHPAFILDMVANLLPGGKGPAQA